MPIKDFQRWMNNPNDIRFLMSSPTMHHPILSDTDDDPNGVSRGIIISDDATVISFVTREGEIHTFAAGELAKGMNHPFQVRRVRSSGTTMAASKIRLVY